MQKKTILVTGASGFVGSHFIKNYSNEYNLIAISLKETSIEQLQLDGVDTVLHLAGISQQSKSINSEKYREVNAKMTEKLALKCR
ncbi:MAG: NAD-dependent epimerase/dehydratase family protein, partial [Bdellovibrionaceae bacterium]|nr:NAD-dependent epimerase/dehydratase family protein [Bdellovibrio sp.]